MAISLQREQHGERRQMHMAVAVMVVGVPAVVIVVMMTAMMVVAMVPAVMAVMAVMAAAVVLRLAFIQLKRLAHTDVVFAHM